LRIARQPGDIAPRRLSVVLSAFDAKATQPAAAQGAFEEMPKPDRDRHRVGQGPERHLHVVNAWVGRHVYSFSNFGDT
jgi:hypothetical protein